VKNVSKTFLHVYVETAGENKSSEGPHHVNGMKSSAGIHRV